jgi:heptosyltransferase-2
MSKFLIIQTAFIGDVVLATAVAEKLHSYYPESTIHFLVRNGNESLLLDHPFISKVWVWDKQNSKLNNLLQIATSIRKEQYTHVINLHRFASSGLITLLSGAKNKIGFDKNPLSFCYSLKGKHIISEPYSATPVHEVARNQSLIAEWTDSEYALPKLYPSANDYQIISQYQSAPYVCICPSSVWFTKQFPLQKWQSLVNEIPPNYHIYILGGKTDQQIGEEIINHTTHPLVTNLSGQLSMLQSAALMQGAVMNYVNDSAPLHFTSAMLTPVTAVYCSTVPAFGFGPLIPQGRVVEVSERLACRPCGLHGHRSCPQQHFNCAHLITNEQLLWWTLK